MPSSNGIYYDTGGGGLCRMRALNAFFGNNGLPTIDNYDFNKYIREYDKYLKDRFNITTSSASFDLTNSDQTNLVSWVLGRHGVYAKHYALNEVYGNNTEFRKLYQLPFLFVYNDGHIWTVIKKSEHYKIDNGITLFNFESLFELFSDIFL